MSKPNKEFCESINCPNIDQCERCVLEQLTQIMNYNTKTTKDKEYFELLKSFNIENNEIPFPFLYEDFTLQDMLEMSPRAFEVFATNIMIELCNAEDFNLVRNRLCKNLKDLKYEIYRNLGRKLTKVEINFYNKFGSEKKERMEIISCFPNSRLLLISELKEYYDYVFFSEKEIEEREETDRIAEELRRTRLFFENSGYMTRNKKLDVYDDFIKFCNEYKAEK